MHEVNPAREKGVSAPPYHFVHEVNTALEKGVSAPPHDFVHEASGDAESAKPFTETKA